MQTWTRAADNLREIGPEFGDLIDWFNQLINPDVRSNQGPASVPTGNDTDNENDFVKKEINDNNLLNYDIIYLQLNSNTSDKNLSNLEKIKFLLESASPQVILINKKIDAIPNIVFDKPAISDKFTDTILTIYALIDVIIKSLPNNSSEVIRNCLGAYKDELLARGNSPILNILKAMASSIAAEVWQAPDTKYKKDDPDKWRVRDPREWDPGTVDLFRAFFRYHSDVIDHFPLDRDREKKYAAIKVNEIAATGRGLTDPVDAVTNMIVALHRDGLATDNIMRIVEAHRLYTRDIANLPPAPVIENGAISPKRRHILMTIGFYLHAYSVIGSTASIISWKPDLLPQLWAAIEALIGFIT